MKCKLTYFAAIFLSIAFLSSCNLVKKNHYVSTKGDDSNSGGARQPWETNSYAISQIKSGTLHVEAKVYKEAVNLIVSGSPGKPIIILGEEGAIIDGSFGHNYPGKGLFNIEDASHIIVECGTKYRGLDLPSGVLEKIYSKNAIRMYPGLLQ